jgi:hypothetical protein
MQVMQYDRYIPLLALLDVGGDIFFTIRHQCTEPKWESSRRQRILSNFTRHSAASFIDNS